MGRKYTEAQKRATEEYMKKMHAVKVIMPSEKAPLIKAHAESCGESMNGFINRAINETMGRDNKGKEDEKTLQSELTTEAVTAVRVEERREKTNREYLISALSDQIDDGGASEEASIYYHLKCPYTYDDIRCHCRRTEANRETCVACKREWLDNEVDD